MTDKIYKLAYEEAVLDLMMELCICESQAKEKLNEILKNNPKFIEPLYRQFYNIRDALDWEMR